MKVGTVFLLIGIALSILKWRNLILIDKWWIILSFFLWSVCLYFSIHQKNKDRNIPRPVYLSN